jgi:hypothetical protein
MISEHYNRPSLSESRSMERFYYAQDFGKVRWEAWSTDTGNSAKSEALSQSGRCARLADGAPPDAGWMMIDCRMWTNIVIDPARTGWRVRDFNWPPADLVLQ